MPQSGNVGVICDCKDDSIDRPHKCWSYPLSLDVKEVDQLISPPFLVVLVAEDSLHSLLGTTEQRHEMKEAAVGGNTRISIDMSLASLL